MSPSRDPPSEKETLFTPFQIQIKEKEKPVKLIVQACFAEKIKAEGRVTFQNMFSSMADFRDVVSMLPTLCRAFFSQWKVHLAYSTCLQALQANTYKKIIQIKHNRIKNSNWKEATSSLFTSVADDLNLGGPRKNPASGHNGTHRTQDRRIARSAVFRENSKLNEDSPSIDLTNQWKVPAILLFYKKINSATWKEQKN